MYQCDFCNYEIMYKYNVMRHEKGKHGQNSNKAKHGAIQSGTGVLTRGQPIRQHVQQTSRQPQNVPIQYIEDAK